MKTKEIAESLETVYTHTQDFYKRGKYLNNGITLIALVITIIILLILAGISIASLSDNGLFGRAKEAKGKAQYAQALEEFNLKVLEAQVLEKGEGTLESLINILKDDPEYIYIIKYSPTALLSNNGDIKDTDIENGELKAEIKTELASKEEIYVTYKGYEFKVNNKLEYECINADEIVEIPENPKEPEESEEPGPTDNWDLGKVQIVYDSEEIPVPVPIGYTASKVTGETKIDTGFVIYEGTEQVNDTNKDTAQKTRNQWVWVPIYDVSQMYGTDSNGNLHGKLYNFSSEGTTPLNWTETEGVMSITDSTGYREPDILSSTDTDSNLAIYLSEVNSAQLYKELTRGFSRTIASIQKYGGFYIGRYETGGLSTEDAKVVRGNSDINNQIWYTMYRKCKMLKGTNENVATSIIWGSQWDATLKWLVDSGAKTYSQISSGSWGNFTGTIRPTGYSESWKANNIYDIEGNVSDRTLEASGSSGRVYRGSWWNSTNDYRRADMRGAWHSYEIDPPCGCRGMLYVLL